MKKQLAILALAAVLGSCGKESGDSRKNIIEVPETPAAELLSLDAQVRANYQIYQANPELFGSSGQLKAIQARLDEIKALGTDILYVMPIYTEGIKNASGSPYCVKDYRGVKSSCGSLSDVKALVNAAHSKGMKVMFDWVANHTAWDHPWISSHGDWYRKDASGNIVYPTADGTWKDVAQLNYNASGLTEAMIAEMKYWVTEVGIDGYRCDYAHGVPDAFWKKAIAELKALDSEFIMLAESDYVKLYNDGFDIVYNRALKSALIKLFAGGKAADFVNVYKSSIGETPSGKTKLYFVTNHDDCSENSPISQFKSADGAYAAFCLLAALNGSPMLYSSQETGYDKTINFFGPVSIDWNSNTSLATKYKKALVALQALSRDGAMIIFASESVVFVYYAPAGASKGTLIGVNTSGSAIKVALPSGLDSSLPVNYNFTGYECNIWTL